MSFPSLLAELEVTVKTGTPEKRLGVLRQVTDLFLDELNRLNEEQIGVFDDVLVHLIQRIEAKALIQLSKSLAPVNNSPIEVIRRLAHHDDITIAAPVLAQSKRLTDGDLVSIAKYKGQSHLLAISGRTSLSETVTDVLVERGDTQVHHTLARNSGATFSDVGFATLVKKSEVDENLAEKLGLRLDIPLELLRRLLARASDLVRSRLLASASPQHMEQIQRALATVVNEVGREAAARPRDFSRVDGLVHELNRCGKLTEAVLIKFITERKIEEMIATLAFFCGTDSNLIERLFKNVRHEGLVVACKAAKLSWPTFMLILKN